VFRVLGSGIGVVVSVELGQMRKAEVVFRMEIE
jgi:hypothetical protein